MKKILIALIICLSLCGCSTKKESFDLKKIMAENEYTIIDVRTKEEYNQGHLKDALNIPYDQLDNSFEKDKVIFVYCRSGARSKVAYDTLKNMGYTVYDLGAFESIDLPKE